MNACSDATCRRVDVTEGEMKLLIDKFPYVVAIMRVRGTVAEAEMDALYHF